MPTNSIEYKNDGIYYNGKLIPDISGKTEKVAANDNDWILIEDSEDSNNKKKIKKSSLIPTTGADGQLLIGSSGGNWTLATINGTTDQINVVNTSGSITLSTPQDIAQTSSPIFRNVELRNESAQAIFQSTTYSDSNTSQLKLRRARGTESLPSGILTGDALGIIGGYGYATTAMSSGSRSQIKFVATEDWTDGSTGASLKFDTTANGTNFPETRMTIGDDGNVGIGTETPTHRFVVETHSTGKMRFDEDTAGVSVLAIGNSALNSTCVVSLSNPDAAWQQRVSPGGNYSIYETSAVAHRLTVDTGGNVGIGTSNPSEKLEVAGNLRVNNGQINITNGNTTIKSNDISGASWSNHGLMITSQSEVDKATLFVNSGHAAVTSRYLTIVGRQMSETDPLVGDKYFTVRMDGVITMPVVYSATVGATNRDLFIDSTGKLGYVASSERYKENIQDLGDVSWLHNLRPVTFDYINKEQGVDKTGLIAEEVEKINPKLVSYNENNQPETVLYSDLVTPLLKEIQNLKKRIEQLENK